MRIQVKTPELELLCEKMLIEAFAVRDDADWNTVSALLLTVAEVAAYLRDQDVSYTWTDHQLSS